MYFKQDGFISFVKKPLKLIGHFISLGSNISSTENDVNVRIGKAWTVIDRLSTIWKFDLPNEIKVDPFQAVAVSVLLHGYTTKM